MASLSVLCSMAMYPDILMGKGDEDVDGLAVPCADSNASLLSLSWLNKKTRGENAFGKSHLAGSCETQVDAMSLEILLYEVQELLGLRTRLAQCTNHRRSTSTLSIRVKPSCNE